MLYFGVMFYVANAHLLKDDITRYFLKCIINFLHFLEISGFDILGTIIMEIQENIVNLE